VEVQVLFWAPLGSSKIHIEQTLNAATFGTSLRF